MPFFEPAIDRLVGYHRAIEAHADARHAEVLLDEADARLSQM